MRTRLKLLTVGVVLVTAAVAGCSSTAGSSGAVQDDSVTSASPAAASPAASSGPAPSPDPVTPTVEPTGAPTPLLGAKNNPNCNPGLEYSCGDIGPGGGTVFIAVSTPFVLSNGYSAACSTDCQYMEAQVDLLPGTFPWCVGPGAKTTISPGTGAAIGTGYSNTQTMATFSGYCSSGAANAAIASTSGGYTDWFVPSEDEAQALGPLFYPSIGTQTCWTSSQDTAQAAYYLTDNNNVNTVAKSVSLQVCLARAF
jgi:hypothetical protein